MNNYFLKKTIYYFTLQLCSFSTNKKFANTSNTQTKNANLITPAMERKRSCFVSRIDFLKRDWTQIPKQV